MRYTNLSSRLNDDTCALKNKSLVNDSIIDSQLYNFYYNKDCSCSPVDDIALDNNFTVREGYGYTSGCTVDMDSQLRLKELTHGRERQQLCARTFVGVANINKGGIVPNVESQLINSDDTSDIRNLDKVMEKSFLPISLMPMIPCLSKNVQNPDHIVLPDWGGQDTRQQVTSNEYLSKCGFEQMGKNWIRKSSK